MAAARVSCAAIQSAHNQSVDGLGRQLLNCNDMIRHRLYVDWDCNTIGPDLSDSVKMRIAYIRVLRHVDMGIRPCRGDLMSLRMLYRLS